VGCGRRMQGVGCGVLEYSIDGEGNAGCRVREHGTGIKVHSVGCRV
jgi:hypothetical protein